MCCDAAPPMMDFVVTNDLPCQASCGVIPALAGSAVMTTASGTPPLLCSAWKEN
jgi:hypothetical protein